MVRSTSYSSTGLAQEHNHHHRHHHHHHTDSYPDTEEEDDFGGNNNHSSDTEADGASTSKTRQRSKSHHLPHHRGPYHGKTPNSSVAASPASLRLADSSKQQQQQQQQQQTHNLDNLHETLKRSFGIGKEGGIMSGSEASRSPAAASSIGSIADMVSLKRNIQATCSEAHPYFPFCKFAFFFISAERAGGGSNVNLNGGVLCVIVCIHHMKFLLNIRTLTFLVLLDITGGEINGNSGPSVMLWQFGQEQEIASYHGCHGKVTR